MKNGYRLIDTAYMYGNEEEVGRAVRQAIRDGICKREDVTVITKIYPGSQYANPEQAIQDRIEKLNIDYVDIMLLHHPGDNDVKAYKAMEKQVETGAISAASHHQTRAGAERDTSLLSGHGGGGLHP